MRLQWTSDLSPVQGDPTIRGGPGVRVKTKSSRLPPLPSSSSPVSFNPSSAASASSLAFPEDFSQNRRATRECPGWRRQRKEIEEPVVKYWATLASSPDAFFQPENYRSRPPSSSSPSLSPSLSSSSSSWPTSIFPPVIFPPGGIMS